MNQGQQQAEMIATSGRAKSSTSEILRGFVRLIWPKVLPDVAGDADGVPCMLMDRQWSAPDSSRLKTNITPGRPRIKNPANKNKQWARTMSSAPAAAARCSAVWP